MGKESAASYTCNPGVEGTETACSLHLTAQPIETVSSGFSKRHKESNGGRHPMAGSGLHMHIASKRACSHTHKHTHTRACTCILTHTHARTCARTRVHTHTHHKEPLLFNRWELDTSKAGLFFRFSLSSACFFFLYFSPPLPFPPSLFFQIEFY